MRQNYFFMLIQLFLLKFPLPHNIYKNPFKKIILKKKTCFLGSVKNINSMTAAAW